MKSNDLKLAIACVVAIMVAFLAGVLWDKILPNGHAAEQPKATLQQPQPDPVPDVPQPTPAEPEVLVVRVPLLRDQAVALAKSLTGPAVAEMPLAEDRLALLCQEHCVAQLAQLLETQRQQQLVAEARRALIPRNR